MPSAISARRKRVFYSVLCAVAALGLSYFHQGISNYVGDLFGAMPIAKEAAFPGMYPSNDLLVSAGIRGPFHIYKTAGLLYQWGVNVDLAWFCLLLVLLFITFLALWFISFEIIDNISIASVSTLLLAVVDPWRGTLNWTPLPVPFLVTSVFAIPIGLLSLKLYLQQRYAAAMVTAALMFNIHPSAVILLVLTGSAILIRDSTSSFSTKITWLVASALLALPNALYTLLHLPGNFTAVADVDPHYFYEQFRIFGYHAFIEDHWREGYGWFLANVAGTLYFLRYIKPEKSRAVVYALIVLSSILLLYVVNLYVFHSRAIILLFLFRVTFFIKPIMFAVIAYGLYRWYLEAGSSAGLARHSRYLAIAGFCYSSLSGNIGRSELVLFLSYAIILLHSPGRHPLYHAMAFILAIPSFAELLYRLSTRIGLIRESAGANDIILTVHIVFAFLFIVAILLARSPASTGPAYEHSLRHLHHGRDVRIAVFAILLLLFVKSGKVIYTHAVSDRPLNGNLSDRIYYSRASPSLQQLVSWARSNTPKASLFAFPPVDTMENVMFSQFRIAAERGIYITLFDIYQLSYDVRVYREGIGRLAKLGVKILGRHQVDDSAYHDLSPVALIRLRDEDGVDYAVFEKGKLGPSLRGHAFIFSTDRFAVLDLREVERHSDNH